MKRIRKKAQRNPSTHLFSLPAYPVEGCRGLQRIPAHINSKSVPEIHGTSPAAAQVFLSFFVFLRWTQIPGFLRETAHLQPYFNGIRQQNWEQL